MDEPYIPRLKLLSPETWISKVAEAKSQLLDCVACPRKCHVNRHLKPGLCLVGEDIPINTIAPHFGEEACIQGVNGSGTVFVSGCNLKCSFCQNHELSNKVQGYALKPAELGDWLLRLQDAGCHNINLVTPEHVVPQLTLTLEQVKDKLDIPVVYNTSAYDSVESLQLMDGLVDIYMPDFKVWTNTSSLRYLKAKDYPQVAKAAIKEMHRQVGDLQFSMNGLAQRGVLLRHLVMPNLVEESKKIMEWVAQLSKDSFVHIMNQYKPDANVGKIDKGHVRYSEINRSVSPEELRQVEDAAKLAGLWRFEEPPRHEGFNFIG